MVFVRIVGSRRRIYWVCLSLDGDVARASRRQLEGIDEDTFVRVAGVEGEHAVVDVLLQALAVVARSQGTAGGFREEASFDTLGLGVSGPGVVLDNDAPFTISVLSAQRTSVLDVAGANESLTADPVALIKLFAVIERVVEFLLLSLGDTVD